MSPNENANLVFLLHILNNIEQIKIYTKDIKNPNELGDIKNKRDVDATLMLLTTIGELVSKLTMQLRSEYDNVQWQSIKNFRNQIVHDYFGLKLDTVYSIIKNDITTLKSQVEKIFKEKIQKGIYNIEALMTGDGIKCHWRCGILELNATGEVKK